MYIMKTPSDIRLSKDKKQLTITFDKVEYPLSSEFLRVYSPSAEVQGHGPGQEVQNMLRQLEGVLDVAQEPGSDEGVYLVTSSPGQDVRDILTRQVVDSGFSLRELRTLDITLEDIFLSLTSEEVAV